MNIISADPDIHSYHTFELSGWYIMEENVNTTNLHRESCVQRYSYFQRKATNYLLNGKETELIIKY